MCTPHGGHLKGASHPKICQNAKESEIFATRGNDSEAKIFVDRPGMEMGCKWNWMKLEQIGFLWLGSWNKYELDVELDVF